jgi:hypothetical protein
MGKLQVLEDFFASPSVEIHLGRVVVNLLLAALMAAVLGRVYVRYGTALSNRRQFAKNFLLLACTTMLVITVVKSSLALSLGLVGALSIVRFRSAIKEPEELAYLFLNIAIGLGLGADQILLTVGSFATICGLIWGRALLQGGRASDDSNLFLTVSSPKPDGPQLDQVVAVLKQHCSSVNLKRFDQRADLLEACFQVRFEDFERLDAGKSALLALDSSLEVSFLDDRGVI